jgi:hypothetical protein
VKFVTRMVDRINYNPLQVWINEVAQFLRQYHKWFKIQRLRVKINAQQVTLRMLEAKAQQHSIRPASVVRCSRILYVTRWIKRNLQVHISGSNEESMSLLSEVNVWKSFLRQIMPASMFRPSSLMVAGKDFRIFANVLY